MQPKNGTDFFPAGSRLERLLQTLVPASLFTAIFFLPISKALMETGLSLALAGWIIKKLRTRQKLLVPAFLAWPYLAFVFLLMVQALLLPAADRIIALRGVLKWLEFLGVFFLTEELCRSEKNRNILMKVFLGSMILVALSGFYQLYTGYDFLRGHSLDPGRVTRMKSSLGAPNNLAIFLYFAMIIPFTPGLFSRPGPWLRRIIRFILPAFFLTAFVLTFSRGALIALAFSGAIHLLLLKRFKLLAAAAFCLFAALALSPNLRTNYVTSLELTDTNVQKRLGYWEAAWSMIKDRPVMGIGANLFHRKFPEYRKESHPEPGYAHNSYLQIWSEAGTSGILIFLFPLIRGFRRGLSEIRRSPAGASRLTPLSIPLLAFSIHAFFDNHFFALQVAMLFWIFWGVLHARLANGFAAPAQTAA